MSRALSVLNHSHGYIHDQGVPALVWTVIHNQNRKPSVTVVNSIDEVVIGKIQYITENTLTITFSSSFSGKAYLN